MRKQVEYSKTLYNTSFIPLEVPEVGDARFGVKTVRIVKLVGGITSITIYTIIFAELNYYDKLEYVEAKLEDYVKSKA